MPPRAPDEVTAKDALAPVMTTKEERAALREQAVQGNQEAQLLLMRGYLALIWPVVMGELARKCARADVQRRQQLADEALTLFVLKFWGYRSKVDKITKSTDYWKEVARNTALEIAEVEERHTSEAIVAKYREHKREPPKQEVSNDPGVWMAITQLAQEAERAINELRVELRMTMKLLFKDGLKVEEVAEKLQVSRPTVRKRRREACKSIAPVLKDRLPVAYHIFAVAAGLESGPRPAPSRLAAPTEEG